MNMAVLLSLTAKEYSKSKTNRGQYCLWPAACSSWEKTIERWGWSVINYDHFCVALSIKLLQERISVRCMSLKYMILYNNQNCLASKNRISAGSKFLEFGDEPLIKMLHKYRWVRVWSALATQLAVRNYLWLELPHDSMIKLLVSWAAFVRARPNDDLHINGWNASVRFKRNILELVIFNRIARFRDKGRVLLMWNLIVVKLIPNSVQTGHLDSVSVYKESQIRARLEEWSHGTLESVEVSSLPPAIFLSKFQVRSITET